MWVPRGVEIDTWSWRNLALADIQPFEEEVPTRAARLRHASGEKVTVPKRRVFLMEQPEKLPQGPVVILSAGRPNLFLAPASRLEELRRQP
jgi:hypothetical protein